MKKYDRDSRKWLEEKEVERKNSKRKLCKGGREHDWVLCLPWHVTVTGSVLGLDKVEEYYRIEDEREDAEIEFDRRLEALGVQTRLGRLSRIVGRRRCYICSVCLKRSY